MSILWIRDAFKKKKVHIKGHCPFRGGGVRIKTPNVPFRNKDIFAGGRGSGLNIFCPFLYYEREKVKESS